MGSLRAHTSAIGCIVLRLAPFPSSPLQGYLIQKREVQPQVDEASRGVEEGEIFT